MPRRRLFSSGQFDQNVFVEKIHLIRAHQGPGDAGGRRGQDKNPTTFDPPPVAIVTEEDVFRAVLAVFSSVWTWFACILLQAFT